MSARASAAIALVGRIFLSFIFIVSGFSKLAHWGQAYSQMEAHGMFAVPFFLALSLTIEILGGIGLLVGYRTRSGAALLLLYLIPVTLTFHDFWDLQGPERQAQLIHFMKNLSIMGGLMLAAAFGPGRRSIDQALERQPVEDRLRDFIPLSGR